ncbi:hypothetical protein CWO90_29960 [Bradyrhizobium sp. Leo121]|nr:hypothetical protein CWO90_29960 [Bradyrhizobium sp. Leo121]
MDTGSREENASNQESRASVLIQSEPKMLERSGAGTPETDQSSRATIGTGFAAAVRGLSRPFSMSRR